MTVRDLIAELQKVPQNAEVQVWSGAVEDFMAVDEVRYDPEDPNTEGAVRIV